MASTCSGLSIFSTSTALAKPSVSVPPLISSGLHEFNSAFSEVLGFTAAPICFQACTTCTRLTVALPGCAVAGAVSCGASAGAGFVSTALAGRSAAGSGWAFCRAAGVGVGVGAAVTTAAGTGASSTSARASSRPSEGCQPPRVSIAAALKAFIIRRASAGVKALACPAICAATSLVASTWSPLPSWNSSTARR